MPKKTAYSRSGAQRNKTKQKSFELVRPVSDENVLETVEDSEEEGRAEDVVEITSSQSTEDDEGEVEEVEVVKEVSTKNRRGAGAQVSTPAAATAVVSAPANEAPKSAAARMAARRQAAQRAQRSPTNLITVEHYNYVRKDLIFILILAVIMFSAIIVLHFVLGN